ncbi:MAG: ArnT family glycosyltransferase [Bacteroidia bacterium]
MENTFLSKTVLRQVLLLGLLLLIAWLYSYIDILPLRPGSVHQWRQTDCLSLADNYYQGNWNLFKPSLHILFSDDETTGKSAGEFPLLYYFVALLWKLFGKHEYIFRLVNIAIAFWGMNALFRLSYRLLKDVFWAVLVVVFLFASPIFAFYTNNFLINVPAFSLMLVAVYYFYRFWEDGKNKFFYASMSFFLLVGLFKISTLLVFVIIGLLFLAELSKRARLKSQGLVFFKPKAQLIPFVLVVFGVSCWYLYARHYSNIHGGKYTLNYIQSYWVTPKVEVDAALKSLREFIFYQVMSPASWIYCLLCLIYLGVNFRRMSTPWKFIIPSVMIGYFAFVMLFFYSLNNHDYYHIDFLIVPLVLHLAFMHYLSRQEPVLFRSFLLKLFFSAFMLYNVLYCANNMHLRYWGFKPDEMYRRQLLSPKVDMDNWAWHKWAYLNGPYETATPVLRAMGIKRSDPVICPDDCSFSISLYLMDQVGWTNIGGCIKDTSDIADRIRHGAKYMMIIDTAAIQLPYLKQYEGHELTPYRSLHIYDLRPYADTRNQAGRTELR